MRRPGPAAFLVLAFAFAGCTDPGFVEPSALGADSFDYIVNGKPVACCQLATKTNVSEKYMLYVRPNPAGALAAFEWTVPEGAYPTTPRQPGSILLEVRTNVAEPSVPIERWALFVFRLDDGAPALIGGRFFPPSHEPETGPKPPTTHEYAWVHFEATVGERLGLVLAAHGPEGRTFAASFFVSRMHAGNPAMAAGIAQQDFRSWELRQPVFALKPLGEGTGFSSSIFVDDNGPTSQLRWSSGDFTVEESRDWANHSYRLRLTMADSAPIGWGLVLGGHQVHNPEHAGEWELVGFERGTPVEYHGRYARTGHPLPDAVLENLTMPPHFLVEGDGQGASHLAVEFRDVAQAPRTSTCFVAHHLGTPLATLLGHPGRNALLVDAPDRWPPISTWGVEVASGGLASPQGFCRRVLA